MPHAYHILFTSTTLALSLLTNTTWAQTSPSISVVRVANTRAASITTHTLPVNANLAAQATHTIEKYFNALTTFQASFTQTTTGEDWAQEGIFSFQRPGKFVWNYQSPETQRIISTGSAMYFVDPKGVITQLPRNAGMARLLNNKQLKLSQAGLRLTHIQTKGPHIWYHLTSINPSADTAALKTMAIGFTRVPKGTTILSSLSGTDLTGTTTTVTFSHIQENIPIASKTFKFEPRSEF